jgi:hypothetical protein
MLDVIQKLTEQPDLKLYVTGALWVIAFFFGDVYLEAVLAIVLLLIFDTIKINTGGSLVYGKI